VYGPGNAETAIKTTTSSTSSSNPTVTSPSQSQLQGKNYTEINKSSDDPCNQETTESDKLRPTTPERDEEGASSPALPVSNPNWLPWLSVADYSLMSHFTVTLTRCLSLHQTMQDDFCTALVPMALDTSHGTHLLSAVLALSAIHQSSLGCWIDDTHLAQLRHSSLRQLRRQVIGQDTSVDEKSIATALSLCLCDILLGGEKPRSWRLHLQGAATMIKGHLSSYSHHRGQSGNMVFLWRWWRSLEALAVLSGSPSVSNITADAVQTPSGALTVAQAQDGDDYIDIFDGFSTKLLPVIEEVNMLAAESDALRKLEGLHGLEDLPDPVRVLRFAHTSRCSRVAADIQKSMMTYGAVNHAKVDHYSSRVGDEEPDDPVMLDFPSLNEAYHLAVLLQLYQRVMNLSITDSVVQRTVKRLIRCMKRITLYDHHASPGVATLQPIFTLGCAAHDAEDRVFVIDWLEKMRRCYALGNTDSARKFLLELWQKRDEDASDHASSPPLQWHQLLADKQWDLSLY
jgi:hypothetical protein